MKSTKITLPCRRLAWLVAAFLPLCLSCGKETNDPAKTTTADGKSPDKTADKAPGKKGPVIDGEHFTTRVIQDPTQRLPVGVFAAPEKWKDKSRVMWNYQDVSNPVTADYLVENPANEEAVQGFPALRFCWVTPNYGYGKPGQNSLGLILMQRMPTGQALLSFVQQARGRMPKFKVIGGKEMPDLAKALNVPQPATRPGFAVKVSYELNGHAVEEEFYTVAYSIDIPYDGPQGHSVQNNWGLDYLHSFRAPAGTLDKRRAVFAAIPKSFRINPAWQARVTAINNYLQQQFNAQLKAGYDQIAAAGALSRQISANNDAMIASIDRQLQSSRPSGSVSGNTRNGNDKFDDYIRGVETVDDPYYGTSQHSINEQYHWTDGYGSYRHSNDGTYNPNQYENGDWQLMQPTR